MLAEEWAALLEEAASDGRPLSKGELSALAAVMRDVPARLDLVERVVNDLKDRVV